MTTASKESPSSSRNVPTKVTGASVFKSGRKLKAMTIGRTRVITSACETGTSQTRERTVRKFSPTKLKKTVQIANCCTHTLMTVIFWAVCPHNHSATSGKVASLPIALLWFVLAVPLRNKTALESDDDPAIVAAPETHCKTR